MFKFWKKDKISTFLTDTFIGEGTIIEGPIRSAGSVRVEGQLRGDIFAEGDVVLGESAFAISNVTARNVFLAGQVTGNVRISGKLTITATGKLYGNLDAATIAIEEGGVFQGNSAMDMGEPVVSPVERRAGRDRRVAADPNWTGEERRSGYDRRDKETQANLMMKRFSFRAPSKNDVDSEIAEQQTDDEAQAFADPLRENGRAFMQNMHASGRQPDKRSEGLSDEERAALGVPGQAAGQAAQQMEAAIAEAAASEEALEAIESAGSAEAETEAEAEAADSVSVDAAEVEELDAAETAEAFWEPEADAAGATAIGDEFREEAETGSSESVGELGEGAAVEHGVDVMEEASIASMNERHAAFDGDEGFETAAIVSGTSASEPAAVGTDVIAALTGGIRPAAGVVDMETAAVAASASAARSPEAAAALAGTVGWTKFEPLNGGYAAHEERVALVEGEERVERKERVAYVEQTPAESAPAPASVAMEEEIWNSTSGFGITVGKTSSNAASGQLRQSVQTPSSVYAIGFEEKANAGDGEQAAHNDGLRRSANGSNAEEAAALLRNW